MIGRDPQPPAKSPKPPTVAEALARLGELAHAMNVALDAGESARATRATGGAEVRAAAVELAAAIDRLGPGWKLLLVKLGDVVSPQSSGMTSAYVLGAALEVDELLRATNAVEVLRALELEQRVAKPWSGDARRLPHGDGL